MGSDSLKEETVNPGVNRAISLKPEIPAQSRSSPLNAVIASGTSCKF